LTDRRTSNNEDFTEFVELSVPEALTDVIEQVRDEWDGSPFFILAIPEHFQLDAFIVSADAGAERMGQMLDAVRASAELPVAAALAVSSPLFRPTGLVPGEGLLSIFCAHAEGRQAMTFKRFYEDEAGCAALGDTPPM
jgi:hypothetical protein